MIGEIAVLPLVFGLWQVALVFTLLNAAVLAIRIREENARARPLSIACGRGARSLYRGSLLDIARCLRLGPHGSGPRDFWAFKERRVADIAGLERLIEPEVKSLGYDLVRVTMIGGTSDPTLQVMAERPDTRQLDLADCETDFAAAVRNARPRRPDRGQLPARGQLAGHRPAADPPQGLSPTGRATRRASRSPSRATAASNSRARLSGLDGDTVKLTGQGRRRPTLCPSPTSPRPSCS